MRPRNTLRVRFALWTAGLLLAALAAFGTLVYVLTARSLWAGVDQSLQVSAVQAVAALNVENGQLAIEDSLPDPARFGALRDRGLTLRVVAPDGRTLQAIGPYHDLAPAAVAGYAATANPASDDPVRWYTAPISESTGLLGYVQVGQGLDEVNGTLDRLLVVLLFVAPLLVVLAGGGGYLLAARALAPIDAITRTAQAISAADLHARLGLPPSDDEVGRLAWTFDGMIARLEEAFARERQFTADASHELRTPLAAMQAILGVIRERERTPAEYAGALEDLQTQTGRLRALTDDLLALARSDAHILPALREQLDLGLLLDDVTETLRPLAEERGLGLTCVAAPDLWVSGDRDALIRLWLNLLDNALKYTATGAVTVTAQSHDAAITITVRDTGPGIAAEHLPHLFDRFYRAERARSAAGAGLGLAIVRAIVDSHGGTIAVQSALGNGTTMTVTLPR